MGSPFELCASAGPAGVCFFSGVDPSVLTLHTSASMVAVYIVCLPIKVGISFSFG